MFSLLEMEANAVVFEGFLKKFSFISTIVFVVFGKGERLSKQEKFLWF